MATVTGLTAERMLQLALEWENVQTEQTRISGAINQLANSMSTVVNVQQDINNNQIPNINQDISAAQISLNDLNEVQLPNLNADLAAASLRIDTALAEASNLRTDLGNLNSTTLPGLTQTLTDLEDDLILNIDERFPIGATQISDDAISTPKLAANAVVALKIASNEILARHIKALEISAGHIAANAIETDKIVANAVIGDKIAANTITANKLLVQGENLLTDPGFESAGLSTHNFLTGASWLTENVGGTAPRTGTRCVRITLSAAIPAASTIFRTGGSITNVTTTNHPKVSPGERIRIGFWVYTTAGSTLQAGIQTFIRSIADPATNIVGTPIATGWTNLSGGGWQYISHEVEVPPAATDPNLYITSGFRLQGGVAGEVVRVDDMIMRRRFDGSLILDGTLTTQHIVSTGISASVLTSGTINANVVTVNNLNGGSFVATISMTSKKITGGEIVGTKFSTAETTSSTPRLEINDDIEAGSIKGKFAEPESTAPVLINPKITGTGTGRRQVLYLSSGTMGGGIARIEIRSGTIANGSQVNIANDAGYILLDAQDVRANNRFEVLGGSTFRANIDVTGGSNVNLSGDNATLRYVRYDTSNGGPGFGKAMVNAQGAFYRADPDPSRRELKKNITPLTVKQALVALDVEAVSFRWKDSSENGIKPQAGFIVEQAVSVGAELWVRRRPHNEEAYGIHYGEFTAAHNVLIKDQRYRIERLEVLVRRLIQNSQNGSEL